MYVFWRKSINLRKYLKEMLIQFTVANYRSILAPMTLSMEPTSISDFPENLMDEGKRKLLTSAGVYGANSSGKSNFLDAIAAMKRMIQFSFQASSHSEIPYDPFLKKVDSSKAPTYFEIVFSEGGTRFRYGFEFNATLIESEWLYETEKRSERPLFLRARDVIEVFPKFKEGLKLESRTRPNALFLTVVDQFNGSIAGRIDRWFSVLRSMDGMQHISARGYTTRLLEISRWTGPLVELYRKLDLGFEDIRVEKDFSLVTKQKLFGSDCLETGEFVEFDARTQESSGTNKVIDMSGPILDTLNTGGCIIVDEFDAKLHPLLTLAILRLFQNEETNPKHAQLIFATHDSNLLQHGRLRRDQIYFTEKDKVGATQLYSLVEYGGVRKDRSFEKDYLQGRYGAIPFIA